MWPDIDQEPKNGFALKNMDEYPVTLALWHWNMNGVATPVSGDPYPS